MIICWTTNLFFILHANESTKDALQYSKCVNSGYDDDAP